MRFASSPISSARFTRAHHFSRFFPSTMYAKLLSNSVWQARYTPLSLSLFVRLLDMRFSLSLFLSVLSSSSWESLEIDSRRGGCEVFLSWKGRSVGGGFDGRLIRLELNGKWKQRWIPEHFYFWRRVRFGFFRVDECFFLFFEANIRDRWSSIFVILNYYNIWIEDILYLYVG